VIGYYLANRVEVDINIQRQGEKGERIRREWEAEHPATLTEAELLARLEAERRIVKFLADENFYELSLIGGAAPFDLPRAVSGTGK